MRKHRGGYVFAIDTVFWCLVGPSIAENAGEEPKPHLCGQIKRIIRQWLSCRECKGDTRISRRKRQSQHQMMYNFAYTLGGSSHADHD
jgi:hypothetical protein